MAFSIQKRFSIFYFFLTGYFAIPLVFLPLLCHARGFNAQQIAVVGVGSTLCSCFGAPFFLSLAAKHFGARQLVSFALFACAFLFLLLYGVQDFLLFLLIWVIHHFFFKASALVDARTIRLSAESDLTFEIVRTWGSIGFVLISYLIGLSLSSFGPVASVLVGTFFLFLTFCSFPLISSHFLPAPERRHITHTQPQSSIRILSLAVLCLLGVNLLNWFSHAPLYLYFSIYLKEMGWSGPWISTAWALGVLGEITLFLTVPRLCKKPSHYANLLVIASVVASFRWLLLSLTTSMPLILMSQTLHAFSFGAVYLASMKLIFYLLPDEFRDRGQGYVQAAGLGGGTLLGNIYFGYYGAQMASYSEMPLLFGTASLIVLCCIPLSMIIRKSSAEFD